MARSGPDTAEMPQEIQRGSTGRPRKTISVGDVGSARAIAKSDQIGRLGVMYVRSLLTQAGVVHNEIPGGEDHLAIDLTLTFPVGSVSVQVKTGTKSPNKDGSISVPTRQDWRDKWHAAKTPVYLVYVRLEKEPPADWIEHADLSTLIHARALWTRVNDLSVANAKVPESNRLTAATFGGWVEDFTTSWGKAATA